MVDDLKNMMESSLNLKGPWYVKGAEFHSEEPAIHICVGVKNGARIVCPKCGAATKRYGYEPNTNL